MYNERLEILNAMAKIPGLRDLVIAVEDIPDAAEFDAMNAEFQADMEATLGADWAKDFAEVAELPAITASAPLAVHAVHAVHAVAEVTGTRSHRTTIRIPKAVQAAFKARARATGTRYQTLMNRALRAASESW